jgi:hypothetical protein
MRKAIGFGILIALLCLWFSAYAVVIGFWVTAALFLSAFVVLGLVVFAVQLIIS